ncbi:hypothetical protein PQX77_016285 [Marasmius sp. AFHP31]|nr:hypothetical protein PQX77_016285 [Marasmius sp. AFHP31]
MLDDHADYTHAILTTRASNPDLALELMRQQAYRLATHSRIAERLQLTSQLDGFTSDLTPAWATDILGLARLDGSTPPSVQIDLVCITRTSNPLPNADGGSDEDEGKPTMNQSLVDFFAGLLVSDGQGRFDKDDLY